MAESGNLIYIIGLLYSLIIIGIAMYIISKSAEETTRCNFLKDQDTSEGSRPSDIPASDDLTTAIRDAKITLGGSSLLVDAKPISYIYAKGDPTDQWNPTITPLGDSVLQDDGAMDISYSWGGEQRVSRLICNSGTFTIPDATAATGAAAADRFTAAAARAAAAAATEVTYKIDSNNRLVAKNGEVPRVVIDNTPILVDAKFDQVTSYNGGGILLQSLTSPGVCLINPSLIDNYDWQTNNQIEEARRGKLKKYSKYSNNCLLNYQFKTAYNCCAVNSPKNSFVSECALKYCIDNGAKCLDFEIFSVNDRAVVGVSSKIGNTNMKESYNDLNLEDVLDTIQIRMTPNVPLILYLRIKSNRIELLERVQEALGNTTLTKHMVYSNNNYGKLWECGRWKKDKKDDAGEVSRDIMKENISKFHVTENVIIALDVSETKWSQDAAQGRITTVIDERLSPLWKIVNLMAPGQIENISMNKISTKTEAEKAEIMLNAKSKLYFVQPDPVYPFQHDFTEENGALDIGCQLVAAPLQYTKKPNIKKYEDAFDDYRYKPKLTDAQNTDVF
uniref:PI-PLC Y-box domain-containing protein n=1 Tax=viral metagenome TaxID=1070528 RepID=A0A6C0BW51_9ZZZZ